MTRQAISSQPRRQVAETLTDTREVPIARSSAPSTREVPLPQTKRSVPEVPTDFRVNSFAPRPVSLTRQTVVSRGIRKLPEAPRMGLLGRLIALLRGGAAAPKKLRLAETVALGEKRFVAIIDAEGRKYLIGGGTSGVALLTRLDDATNPIEHIPQFSEVLEVTR